MARKSGFVYRGKRRTVESVVRKSKQAGGVYDGYLLQGMQSFKAKEGECSVRIMPPSWGTHPYSDSELEKLSEEDTTRLQEEDQLWGDHWNIDIYMHYNVGPDNGTYLCLDKMQGQSCPVCEARRATRDEDEATALRPSWRALCWVIDRDNEKAGPQVWSMPVTLFRDINLRSVDKKSNTPLLIDDPEEGFDIVFSREGTDKRTKYTAVEVLRDPTPLHDDDDVMGRWWDYICDNPLPNILRYYDEEHIEKVLFGTAEAKSSRSSEEEEEERRPAARGGRGARRGGDEDEEAERPARRRGAPREDTEEDGERREEPPARRRSARRSSHEEEEEEPPFDKDGGGEEESSAPPRRRRSAAAQEEDEDEASGDAEGDEDPSARARRRLQSMRERRR